jgi:HSP20 family protein
MDKPKRDRTKWIQVGLTASLAVAVAVLAVLLYRSQRRLDALGEQANPNASPSPSASATPLPDQSNKRPDVAHDDWFFSTAPDKWDPFTEMQEMQKHIEQLFDQSFVRFGKSDRFSNLVKAPDFDPKIDVKEEKDQFVIRVDLPGVEESSVDVHVNGRDVEISGKRDDVVTDKDDEGRVVRRERRTGSFSRSIELPEAVNPDKLTAKNDNGVFTIVLPKA